MDTMGTRINKYLSETSNQEYIYDFRQVYAQEERQIVWWMPVKCW